MEAAAVAAAARAHGIHFAATKVISDELDFEMPEMARFIDAQGRFKTASFALFVALRPWLWKPVALLASNSRKAAQALGAHLERFRHDLARDVVPTPAPGAPAVADPVARRRKEMKFATSDSDGSVRSVRGGSPLRAVAALLPSTRKAFARARPAS